MNPALDRTALSELFHRYPLVYLCGCALTGIVIDRAWYRDLESGLVRWGLLACLAFAGYLMFRRNGMRRTADGLGSESEGVTLASSARLAMIGLLTLCLFGIWHAGCESRFRSAGICRLVQRGDQPALIRGKLDRTVSLRPHPIQPGGPGTSTGRWLSRLELQVAEFRSTEGWIGTDGRLLVESEGDLSGLRPGDRLEVHGWLHPFPEPSNPGEPDLRPTYRRQWLHGRLTTDSADGVLLLGTEGRGLRSWIAEVATRSRRSLLDHTGPQTGSLAIALVVGQREFVDRPTRDALLATGTAHLLSVSGMHLAILVVVANGLISAFGFRSLSRLGVIVTICLVYVAVTGGRPPVIRAAILIAMLLLAACVRRPSCSLNALALAALILMVMNPLNVFAPGVHLSFLAVLTLVASGHPVSHHKMIEGLGSRENDAFDALVASTRPPIFRLTSKVSGWIGSLAWVSLSITVVALPLVWYQFHLVSLVSVVSNVLVWGGLMLALPCGVLTVLLDPIHPLLATAPGFVCEMALRYVWFVIRWTASWPMGHFWLPSPPLAAVMVFYAVLAISLLFRQQAARRSRGLGIAVWIATAWWLATTPSSLPDKTIETTFVDVGHGTSAVIRSEADRVWLYDCGRMGNQSGSSRDIDTTLWSLGMTRVEMVFLSHADADHYNALPALLERFRIDCVVTPPGMLDQDEPAIRVVREAIDRFGVPVLEWHRDVPLMDSEDGRMEILHPPKKAVLGSDNANSLVLQLTHAGRCLVFPGDLEPPGTGILTSHPRPVPGGVLMAPHHGSVNMDAETILAWAKPQEIIVSGGRRAMHPRVTKMLSFRGSGVHVTSRSGAIRVRIGGEGSIEIRRWREQPW